MLSQSNDFAKILIKRDEESAVEKLLVLGTGHALTTKYYNTCFILDNGEEYLLVDGGGGNGILNRFKAMDLDWGKVHHVYVTHEHTDHLLGIIWVIRMISYQMVENRYDGELKVFAHAELCKKIESICLMTLRPVELGMIGERIHLIPIHDGEQRTLAGYTVTFFDIHSTKAPQFGFTLRLKNGKKLVCLGDEPYHYSCEKYVTGADWLLTEAYCLYKDREVYTPYRYHHSTVKEASQLAEQLGIINLVLWHTEEGTYPNRKVRYSAEAKEYFNGNVFIPDDGEVIML